MSSKKAAIILLGGVAGATFLAGGALGPNGLSGAFNSIASAAQFTIAGTFTLLGAGFGAKIGGKALTKGMDGLGALAPGIVGMVLGFLIGGGVGAYAGNKTASLLPSDHAKPAACECTVPSAKTLSAIRPSV